MTTHYLKTTGLIALSSLFISGSAIAQDVAEKQAPEASQKEAAWTPLFNNKDLTGWKNAFKWGKSEVIDGEIHLTGDKKFFLTTEKQFDNFELEAEIMLPKVGPANSGIMFRCHVEENKVYGYQAECDPTERGWSGRLYDEGRRKWELTKVQKEGTAGVQAPLGEWIKYRIVANGGHLQVWVNGQPTTDLQDAVDAKGHIGIQHHGEKGKTYRFRNIRIRPIPATK